MPRVRAVMTRQERMRGLRGLLIHARERPSGSGYRRLIESHLPKAPGLCNWCRQRVDEKGRRLWHTFCLDWAETAFGGYPYTYMRRRPYACSECGEGGRQEYDHELAISVAHELGRKAVLRAFCPDNLRYLCHSCHVKKTARDRVILKILRKGLCPPSPPRRVQRRAESPQGELAWEEG